MYHLKITFVTITNEWIQATSSTHIKRLFQFSQVRTKEIKKTKSLTKTKLYNNKCMRFASVTSNVFTYRRKELLKSGIRANLIRRSLRIQHCHRWKHRLSRRHSTATVPLEQWDRKRPISSTSDCRYDSEKWLITQQIQCFQCRWVFYFLLMMYLRWLRGCQWWFQI